MNYPYNKEVDDLMIYLLGKYEFTNITEYTATLGSVSIWISEENQPFACMMPNKSDIIHEGARPSRLTIKRGISKLNEIKKSLPLKSEEGNAYMVYIKEVTNKIRKERELE